MHINVAEIVFKIIPVGQNNVAKKYEEKLKKIVN